MLWISVRFYEMDDTWLIDVLIICDYMALTYILSSEFGVLVYTTADFIKKGTFSVHSFNDNYQSIPERTGS